MCVCVCVCVCVCWSVCASVLLGMTLEKYIHRLQAILLQVIHQDSVELFHISMDANDSLLYESSH